VHYNIQFITIKINAMMIMALKIALIIGSTLLSQKLLPAQKLLWKYIKLSRR